MGMVSGLERYGGIQSAGLVLGPNRLSNREGTNQKSFVSFRSEKTPQVHQQKGSGEFRAKGPGIQKLLEGVDRDGR